ncbi:unnamed protein product [Adineta ricciae]|uniref:Uncharacterized protein n=1 Tax=Adineta ricciae TaxID=249248 RepID=A0A814IB87_ADIRI|nr:unnamed protein product [Adineta ricciae]CAF1336259.1 unnamed protein product [Adineta ricciae]
MNYQSSHLKRLQRPVNSSDKRHCPSLDLATVHEECDNLFKTLRRPVAHHARRGGGGRNVGNRPWNPLAFLRKRTIHYDLAESFMDHSTNPLSSQLYKYRFKHSTKPWPNGRFTNYTEKLDKKDGNLTDILCVRTFPIVAKRKKTLTEPTTTNAYSSSISLINPVIEEQRKKLCNEQNNLYADIFRNGKTSQISNASQIKKIDIMNSLIVPSALTTVKENKA